MLIPFSPYAPSRLPWSRRLADGANSSCSALTGPKNLSTVEVLALPHPDSPGVCLSAPNGALSLVQSGRFHQWNAQGSLVRHVLLDEDSPEAGIWGPALWLEQDRVALVSPRKVLLMDEEGGITRISNSKDEDFHCTAGLTASQDGRLLVFAGAGDLHVLFHQDQLSLRLSFRRDGQFTDAGPPLHPPTLYKDGRMVLLHELGCLCCSALGEVEWWFPGGDLAHPPVLNREETCGFQDASGRTIFVDSSGTPVNEIAEPMLLAARPRGGWIALGEEALLALDRDGDLAWRVPLSSSGLPPVVDARGYVWVVDADLCLHQISPQGGMFHHLQLPGRPGLLALHAQGRLALSLGHEVWVIGT